MMEELVRSSMTPVSGPVTPQDELHIMEQQLEQPVEQPEEEPMEQPLTQQTPSQVPISAEDFFTQPAPAKSKSD